MNPPAGALADSGWQYQGDWGNFSGTVIGPRHFITARHVGGLVGDRFRYRGNDYETINVVKFPDCDLAVWTVATPMPDWAPLYTGSSEVGQEIVFFGRGTPRGKPVYTNGHLRGWHWDGNHDHRRSWGINTVDAVLPAAPRPLADREAGAKMVFDFSGDASPNEGSVSGGDSGGGVFLCENGVWKLAGVNYGVSGQFSVSGENGEKEAGFSAALFDSRGLWRKTGLGYAFTPELTYYPAPTVSLATRISAYAPRIQAILDEPPRPKLLTRRRVTLAAGLLFALSLTLYIRRARYRLRRLRHSVRRASTSG
ncbi:MAG: hypothetical protein OHK0029_00710 [Armatimonadaceae bacterium]